MNRMAFFTVGYTGLPTEGLLQILDELEVKSLVDVRSVPSSRNPAYRRPYLERLLGDRYVWRGDTLGGRGIVTPGAVEALFREVKPPFALMCMEVYPWECHRHFKIAVQALPMIDFIHCVYERKENCLTWCLASEVEEVEEGQPVALHAWDDMQDAIDMQLRREPRLSLVPASQEAHP